MNPSRDVIYLPEPSTGKSFVFTKTWGETLDQQKSALRWDIKRTMNNLCKKLVDIGEECFVVTVNVANGWVGHMGSVRGSEYINEKAYICYNFLEFCRDNDDTDSQTDKSQSDDKNQPRSQTPLNGSDGSDEDTDDNDEHIDQEIAEEERIGDETMITISRADLDASDDAMSEDLETSSEHMYEKKKNILQNWKSKKIIRKAKQRLTRTNSKGQQQQPSSSITKDRRTSPRKTNDNKHMFCKVCERQFYYRNSYIWHLKSTSHVLKCQLMLRCFKCLEHFPDNSQMYAHIRNCDMVKKLAKILDGD